MKSALGNSRCPGLSQHNVKLWQADLDPREVMMVMCGRRSGMMDLHDKREELPASVGGEAQQLDMDVQQGIARKRKNGGIAEAMKVAEDRSKLNEAVTTLKKEFWSDSSRRARECKRMEVCRLATLVEGNQSPLFPLKQWVIEGVAASMKAAKMVSGEQYLNELKLAHVEAGCDLPAWMQRCFALCKKSLTRMRGPVKKAIEFKPELLTWTEPRKADVRLGDEAWAKLAYWWACAWVLREIELSAMKWEHVTFSDEGMWVRIFLPTSKTDQAARGVRRTLSCCGLKPCVKLCVWELWNKLRRLLHGQPRVGFIFTDYAQGKVSKQSMIKAWQEVADPLVSGHSARRSGAMAYVRAGMAIEDLAFLGRWRSGVVISYAEDALQEVPANRRVNALPEAVKGKRSKMPSTPIHVPDEGSAPMTPVPPVVHVEQKTTRRSLWAAAATKSDQNKVWHRVIAAGWNLPLDLWKTACGWHFVDKSSKVSLSVDVGFSCKKCKKCTEIYSGRDDVKDGVLMADLMGSQMHSAVATRSDLGGHAQLKPT